MADVEDPAHAPARVLVASARLEERRSLEQVFLAQGIGVAVAGCLGSAVKALEARDFDLVVSALSFDGSPEGIDLAHWIVRRALPCGVVFVCSTFPWISANSPLASIPIVLRPVRPALLLAKARRAIELPPGAPRMTAAGPPPRSLHVVS